MSSGKPGSRSSPAWFRHRGNHPDNATESAFLAACGAIAARNEAMRGFTIVFDTGRLEDDRARPPALALNMVGGMREIIHREIAAGRAEDLPGVLPDLMYTVVLPILGPEAAERELMRGYPRGA